MTSHVAMATSSGYRVEMHVIGDRAVDMALNALHDAHVAAEKRPIFIHCQVAHYVRLSVRLSVCLSVSSFNGSSKTETRC